VFNELLRHSHPVTSHLKSTVKLEVSLAIAQTHLFDTYILHLTSCRKV